MLEYFALASVALVAVAIAGIIADRHFVMMMLAVELIFIASAILLVAFFSWAAVPGPDAALMLIAIWSVAAAEVMALIAFYVCIKSRGQGFDVARLSRLKW